MTISPTAPTAPLTTLLTPEASPYPKCFGLITRNRDKLARDAGVYGVRKNKNQSLCHYVSLHVWCCSPSVIKDSLKLFFRRLLLSLKLFFRLDLLLRLILVGLHIDFKYMINVCSVLQIVDLPGADCVLTLIMMYLSTVESLPMRTPLFLQDATWAKSRYFLGRYSREAVERWRSWIVYGDRDMRNSPISLLSSSCVRLKTCSRQKPDSVSPSVRMSKKVGKTIIAWTINQSISLNITRLTHFF